MSISSLELWQRIAAEGIASPMQCRSWAADVAKTLPAGETADGLKVLQKLIDNGKLTKYQAQALAGQSNDPLKRGSWNVLNRVDVPQWHGWLEVTKIDTSKGEQPPTRWACWLKADDLDGLRTSVPSLPRGIQLAQIRHDHLQCIEMPELVNGELQLRVAPVKGASLVAMFKNARPTPEQTQSIIEQVGQALATMHEKQAVHGRVMPDRIFWDTTGGATLACDPISVWTASVQPSTGGVLGEHLNGLQPASFLAPEFLAPRQPPSMASDIYALGATWWWLLTGKPPFEGKDVAFILGQAAEVSLDFANQLIDLPTPIRVCLQHCLAKNPTSRFANGSALINALQAAKASVARGKLPLPQRPSAVQPVSAKAAAISENAKPVVTKAAPVSANAPPVSATTQQLAENAQPVPAIAQPISPRQESVLANVASVEPTLAPQVTAQVVNNFTKEEMGSRSGNQPVAPAASPAIPNESTAAAAKLSAKASTTPTVTPIATGDGSSKATTSKPVPKPPSPKPSVEGPQTEKSLPVQATAEHRPTELRSEKQTVPKKAVQNQTVQNQTVQKQAAQNQTGQNPTAQKPMAQKPTAHNQAGQKTTETPGTRSVELQTTTSVAPKDTNKPSASPQAIHAEIVAQESPSELIASTHSAKPPAVTTTSASFTSVSKSSDATAPADASTVAPADASTSTVANISTSPAAASFAASSPTSVSSTPTAALNPTASTSSISTTTTSQNNTLVARPVVRRRAKRKSKLPWLLFAGFSFLAVVLGVLKLSGALDSAAKKEVAENRGTFQAPVNAAQPTIIAKNPVLDHFRLVDSKDAAWAPPLAPDPIVLDLLPPGAQLYIALRPAQLLSGKSTGALIATLDKQFGLDALLKQAAQPSGQSIESIASLTIAFYSAPAPEQLPLSAFRVELSTGVPMQKLKTIWNATSETVVGSQRLHVGEKDLTYYVPPDEDLSNVKKFSFGPATMMKEVAELEGGAAALVTQFKQLHARTCKQYPIVFFGSPRYLLTEGRGLVKSLPKRLQQQIEPIFGKDSRAGILQTSFDNQWYWELQLLGPTDAESPRITGQLSDAATTAANKVEQWLVDQTPHPYWRALALRFPQMIRTWREFSRFSLEDGIAIANGYLPNDAASNLIVASWIAAQESSTLASQVASNTPSSSSNKPAISPEDILNKPIRLIFDQEPIERALAMVGEEANANIPPDSQLRFELDGTAFEKAGITRNQQMRDFKIDGKPVRDALTEIAKRGNPVTTVKDTREPDQRLIWVVRDDPKNPGKKMISLTTRDTAVAEQIQLSKEFAK